MTRLRFALDLRSRELFTDVLTGRTPALWRAADVQFELALFDDAALYADIGDIDQITLEIKAADDLQGAALLRITADYADLNRTLTGAEWTAGTLAHATLAASATETALDLDQTPSKVFHLVVSALTTDDPAKTLILGTSRVTVHESGAGGTNNSPEPAEDYYTAAESDARFVALADYADVGGDVAAAQAAADAAQADVDALTATVTSHTSTLSSHTTAIGEHETRLDEIEAATTDSAAPGFDGAVLALLLDGDALYAAGEFTTYGGTACRGVAKLSITGQLDGRFAPLSNYVGSLDSWDPVRLALAPDGDLLVAAGYYLTKLDATDGTGRDNTTTPSWATAAAVGIATSGPYWADVAAVRVAGTDYVLALNAARIYTLSADGASTAYEQGTAPYDATFAPVLNADGLFRLVHAGYAYASAGVGAQYDGVTNPKGLRLLLPPNPAGGATPWGSDTNSYDDTFTAGAGTGSEATCVRPVIGYDLTDGPYVIAGNVVLTNDEDHSWNGGSTTRFQGLLKVWLDGLADPTFDLELTLSANEGGALPFAIDGRQRIYFGGPVESINGTAVTPWRLYRVTQDGALDAVFDAFDAVVRCCVVRDDDTLVVGGDFASYGERAARRILFMDAAGQPHTPAPLGAAHGVVRDYAALPDVRNVPALKRGLVCLTDDPPTLHRWNATAEEWTAL